MGHQWRYPFATASHIGYRIILHGYEDHIRILRHTFKGVRIHHPCIIAKSFLQMEGYISAPDNCYSLHNAFYRNDNAPLYAEGNR